MEEGSFINTPEKGNAFAASAIGTAARKLRRFIVAEWYLAKDRECNSSGALLFFLSLRWRYAPASGRKEMFGAYITQALFLSAAFRLKTGRASETTWAK
jgi:hypothetical protein